MIVDIAKQTFPSWGSGSGTIGTTPQALGSLPVLKSVVVRANAGNSGTISVGPQGALDFTLVAGESSPPIEVDDISKIWIVGSAAGQNYSWIAS